MIHTEMKTMWQIYNRNESIIFLLSWNLSFIFWLTIPLQCFVKRNFPFLFSSLMFQRAKTWPNIWSSTQVQVYDWIYSISSFSFLFSNTAIREQIQRNILRLIQKMKLIENNLLLKQVSQVSVIFKDEPVYQLYDCMFQYICRQSCYCLLLCNTIYPLISPAIWHLWSLTSLVFQDYQKAAS